MPVLVERILLYVVASVLVSNCLAQSSGPNAEEKKGSAGTHQRARHLTLASTTKVASEPAGAFLDPLKCDGDGNLYLRVYADAVPGIRKLNSKGERIAVFQPNIAPSDLKIDVAHYFSVRPDGSVYQLIFAHEDIARYVFVYKPDGSYRSKIKLQPGFPWVPAQVAAFPSGNVLVTGLKYDHDRSNGVMWPFTGIFSSDGTLLKEITLEDDDAIHDMAAAGDGHVTSSIAPGTNSAVGRGALEAADDGNIYLMRRVSPAIVYVISQGGEMVRRFIVDPREPDYMPDGMHIAGSRIAVQFLQPVTGEQLLKIIDLEGHELATYDDPGGSKPTLGSAFICYSNNPERFTFLATTEDETLSLKIAEPH
jgi:hypothetical protein